MRTPALAVLCLVLLAGCGGSETGSNDSRRTPTTPEKRGEIEVVYDEPVGGAGAVQAREVLQLGGFDGVAEGFTKNFALPKDITIHAANGTEGPYYDPSTRTITYTYGFTRYVAELLLANFPELRGDDYALGRAWAAVNGFILIHEFGHAFIHSFELPVLGREEDAADSLATVFMTQFVDGGAEYAFDAAKFFDALSARQRKLAPEDYWDEHSLDKQRAYSIVCWIAGASESDYRIIQRAGILGAARLRRCPAEYQQHVRSWRQLLEPHLRRNQ